MPHVASRRPWWAVVGTAVGPLFLVITLVQAATRRGFRLAEHPLSLLALGPGGWVQTANFVVCGTAIVLGSRGAMRVAALPRPVGGLVAAFGASYVAAGIFRTDPWRGFPPDAETVTTWHGVVHAAAAGLGGLAIVAAALVSAVRAHRHGRSGWSWVSGVAAGLGLVLGAVGSGLGDFRVAFLAAAIGWLWTAGTFARAVGAPSMTPVMSSA